MMPGYVVDKYLVTSDTGDVILATTKKGSKKVILKKIEKNKLTLRAISNQIRAGVALSNHPNIAKLLGHHDDGKHCILVFEYVEGKDLFQWIVDNNHTPMKESVARSLLKQLVDALEYTHSQGIAHMDIKLENVLYNEISGKVKLIDFGLCEKLSPACRKWAGTWFDFSIDFPLINVVAFDLFRDYACPCILKRHPFSNAAADVWSLGTLLYSLLFGMVSRYTWCRYDPLTRYQNCSYHSLERKERT